jgi:choline kinase
MQAVIVAAGKGTRLGCVGGRIPKCLLAVDQPILGRQLHALRGVGVDGATVVAGHLAARIDAYLQDGRWGFAVRSVINRHYADTGGGASFLCGAEGLDDDLVYLIGDMVYEEDLIRRLLASRSGDFPVLGVQLRPTGREEMKVRLEHGFVREIGKHIECAKADGEFIGAAFLPRAVLPLLRRTIRAAIDEPAKRAFHFGDMVREFLMKGHRVGWADLTGLFWHEIDCVHDLQRARIEWKTWRAGRTFGA